MEGEPPIPNGSTTHTVDTCTTRDVFDQHRITEMNRFLADFILLTHALFVVFVVVGFVLILVGYVWKWQWIGNTWFRIMHLLSIVFVVFQTWLGRSCPLTIWETQLRQASGEAGYSDSFVQHWLHHFLFYDFPPWVFSVAYTLFGILVALTWVLVPPRRT